MERERTHTERSARRAAREGKWVWRRRWRAWRWRCVSLPAELEGVGWTVELAACGISAPRDLIGEDALERAPRRTSET